MEWLEQFKEFWNQPIPIIGFTVGAVVLGVCVILAKTSLGKRALNKMKKLADNLKEEINTLLKELKEKEQSLRDIEKDFDTEVGEIAHQYEEKVESFKSFIAKQNELIKVLCENSPNKRVKEAYEHYYSEVESLPDTEAIELVKVSYEERIARLEAYIEEASHDEE